MTPNMKITRVGLIREFFVPVSMSEMKALSETDKAQLASAIAREQPTIQTVTIT